MKREIKQVPAVFKLLGAVNLESDVKKWLEEQAALYGLRWLLAHAHDGVIWGRLDNSHLITSSEVNPRDQQVSPPLREETLLQARLFAPHGELLLWCEDDNQWQARLIKDVSANERPIWNEAIDEWQILWGTEAQSLDHGFTLMREGSQGLRHIVPLKVTGISKENRLRLKVRHYIQHESDDRCIGTVGGYARIVASRLVDLTGGDCSEQ